MTIVSAIIAMTDDSDSDDTFCLDPVTGIASGNSCFSELSDPRIVCVGTQSHKEPQIEPLQYVLQQMQAQEKYKVVIVVCLTKIMDEMGVWRRADVQSFSGVNQNKLKLRREEAKTMWNHFLSASGFRRRLLQRGVALEVCVAAGFPREDVLTEATRAIQPQLIVLDRSFAGSKQEKTLQKRLDCDVVLVKSSGEEKILKATAQDRLPEFDRDDRLRCESTAVRRSALSSKSPHARPGGVEIAEISCLQSDATRNQDQAHIRKSTQLSSLKEDKDSDYALRICVCDSISGAQRNFVPDLLPTKGSVVLYEDGGQSA